MLFRGSRYEKTPVKVHVQPDGREVRYMTTRFIPEEPPASLGHRVMAHERLDHIAWQHYRDPERFWRICDGNRAVWPDDLLEEAAILRIPPSEG